jgi:hypothetical protein
MQYLKMASWNTWDIDKSGICLGFSVYNILFVKSSPSKIIFNIKMNITVNSLCKQANVALPFPFFWPSQQKGVKCMSLMKDAIWDFRNTHFYFLLWAYYFSEKEQELLVAEKYNIYKNVTVLVFTAILNENLQRHYEIYSIPLPVYTRKD